MCDSDKYWIRRGEAAKRLGCCKGYVRHLVNGARTCPSGVDSVESKKIAGLGWRYRILLSSGEYYCPPSGEDPVALPDDIELAKEAPRGQKADSREVNGLLEASTEGESISTLEGLIDACGVDLKKWSVLSWSANSWEGFYRNKDDGHTKVRLWQVKASFAPNVLSWVKPAKAFAPCNGPAREQKLAHSIGASPRLCVAIPDTQHGFRWNERRTRLLPMHDRRAIDCVVQLIERLKPELVVHLGDGPDFAEWSTKYPRAPELMETTQPALEELHWDLARIRAAAPDSRMVYLEGNHGFRIRQALIEKLPVALGTHAVGDERPALDLARLLALDDIGWEFAGAYKGRDEDWYWEDRVRFVHDAGVKSGGGKTASAHVAGAEVTTIFGHIHRLEMACRTIHRGRKMRTIAAASPGCLCMMDGSVPGVSARPDWQHGCALIWLTDAGEHVQLIPIHRGTLVYGGEIITGVDRGEEIAASIGRPVG